MAVAPTQETGSVEEAKRRLREASAGFDPYALVRARPLSCAGGAFLLGLGWKWLRPGRAVPALAMLSLQLVGRALAQNLGARLKDGLTQERPVQDCPPQKPPAEDGPDRTGEGSAAGNKTGAQGGAAASDTSV